MGAFHDYQIKKIGMLPNNHIYIQGLKTHAAELIEFLETYLKPALTMLYEELGEQLDFSDIDIICRSIIDYRVYTATDMLNKLKQ